MRRVLIDSTIVRAHQHAAGARKKRAGRRLACIERDVFPNVPNRRNRTDPWPFFEDGYVERNRVERLFAKLEQFRRVATRYEKLKETFLGMIHLALVFIRLRKKRNVNSA